MKTEYHLSRELLLLRSPPENLLTAALVPAQDVENVTKCQYWGGT